MKIKKIIICLALALMLSFATACFGPSQPVSTMFGGSYWLENPDTDIGTVDEECVYTVTLKPGKDSEGNVKLKGNVTGTFTTHLTTSFYNGTKCYKFETKLVTTGNYETDKVYEVNDLMTSEVFFLGNKDKLFPLYSKKTIKSTTPVVNVDGTMIKIIKIAYSTESVYDKDNKTATVSVTPDNENTTEGYNVVKDTVTLEKITKSGNYFDNEALIFIPRACNLVAGFSQSFVSIDPLTHALNRMVLNVNSSAPTSEFSLENYVENGINVGTKKMKAYNATISLTGTFTGSPIKVCYSSEASSRKRLVSVTSQLPHDLGSFEYLLKEVKQV